MNIGIICPSEIAYRRFMPALMQFKDITFIGLSIYNEFERFGSNYQPNNETAAILSREREKANRFISEYGGKLFSSYEALIASDEIDAVYIPLPPALHYYWASKALKYGKHVLIEKPSTTCAYDTDKLIQFAQKKGLAIHENYMFAFHNQLNTIDEYVSSGNIGDVRLYRISFGFPRRNVFDFRYNKALGGGALIDAGGYTIKYASMLLGRSSQIAYAHLNYLSDFEVDIYGSGALVNQAGVTAQIAFGMDNSYKCELEIWGSKGSLSTGRVLTAPANFTPEMHVKKENSEFVYPLPADDAFKKSIQHFIDCIHSEKRRKENYMEISHQAHLVDEFRRLSENSSPTQ